MGGACHTRGALRAGLAACKTLASNSSAHAADLVQFSSLMVQRGRWDTSWGPKKLIFLIRDIDGPAMKAAPAESCRSVVLRSPWGRLGSLLDVRKRLHRTRGGFHRCIHISKVLCALLLWTMILCRYTLARLTFLCINMGARSRIISHLGTWDHFGRSHSHRLRIANWELVII